MKVGKVTFGPKGTPPMPRPKPKPLPKGEWTDLVDWGKLIRNAGITCGECEYWSKNAPCCSKLGILSPSPYTFQPDPNNFFCANHSKLKETK